MNGELSEDLTETFKMYIPELLVASGRNIRSVRYGGDVISCEVLLFDHIPEIVTVLSTL